MPLRRLLAAVVVAGCASLALGTTSVQAAGQVLQESGTATYIVDGDTVDVDVAGDSTSTPVSVRLIGVQAMEAYHPSMPDTTFDACHAKAPRDELTTLLLGKQVRLYSVSKSSTSLGRLLRSIYVQQGSSWVDVQRILLQKSMALPISASATEKVHDADYMTVAQQAAAGGAEMWDPTSCGSGPNQDIPLSVIVHADANGDDDVNVNDEWVSIQNLDPTRSLSLKGWWLRDSSLTFYFFPSNTTVPPGNRVLVRVGKGTNTTLVKYWGQGAPVFDNGGDGAYLFDPDGDLRNWMMYPCKVSCTDPEKGNLTISSVSYDPAGVDAHHLNSEWVKVHNTSTHRINLRPYMVRSAPYSYTFSIDTWLAAGGTIVVHVGKGTATSTSRYWGKTAPILNNSGDKVELVTYTDIVLSCKAWGSLSC